MSIIKGYFSKCKSLENGRKIFFERPNVSLPTIQKGIIFPFSLLGRFRPIEIFNKFSW